ncbi:beta-ketoacyl synthase N-terminal-like domain-containing protein [Amycolatopsis minnesotensis]|uniref:Beta-ketoacyl synthase N-terminal-like domain-containing protein n=1 Tax=Amycolatopsis minnesotensis TaxID=337894 RepID=A0ABP5BY13_9PSEU
MSATITGWSRGSVVAGPGRATLASWTPGPVTALSERPLPAPDAHAVVDFDVRAELGRRGTSFLDRATSLAVVACRDALADAGLEPDDTNRDRIGVALGTTVGSFKSTSEFSLDSKVSEKPYLVNPVLFPNTVMNCAAGQAAIRFGLRGVNATVAGGPIGFLAALRYATNALERGYAGVMLVGAAEEFSEHRAWAHALSTGDPKAASVGEAAVVFVVEASPTGRAPQADVLAVCTGYGPAAAGGRDRALRSCTRRALRTAGVGHDEIVAVVTGEADEADLSEYRPVTGVLGKEVPRLLPKVYFGDCGAATGGLGVGLLLAGHRGIGPSPAGAALVTGCDPDGAVAVAVLRVVRA